MITHRLALAIISIFAFHISVASAASRAGDRARSAILHPEGTSPAQLWKDPHVYGMRRSSAKPIQTPTGGRVAANLPPATYHVVDENVLNLGSIIGGGRKLIRRDCSGDPDNLEAVYARDIGFVAPSLFNALSTDNGETWNSNGPMDMPVSSPCIGFCEEYRRIGYNRGDSGWMNVEVFPCLQTSGFWWTVLNTDPYLLQQAITSLDGSCAIYWSWIGFEGGNPYVTYFMRSTDGGETWSDPVNLTETLVPSGFEIGGMDGALSMDARGDFVAGLIPVVLDTAWALANGFTTACAYPAYTQSTDGGETWSNLELPWGTDISNYPHTYLNPPFDSLVAYVGGMGAGVGYTALNDIRDNTVITEDGKVHLTYTMNDTSYGYVAVFYTVVDGGTFTNAFVGFPEDPALEGESGIAYAPSIAKTEGGAVVIGWTEFVQPSGMGDICYHAIPGGEVVGSGPVNVTQTAGMDETYQRIVDYVVPTSEGSDSFYIDWLFLYTDPGTGGAADSTLWHLQTVAYIEGGAGIGDGDPELGIPRTFVLAQNYPNPFNPSTSIDYRVSEPSHVAIRVYDVRGRLVKALVDGEKEAGDYTVHWNGRDRYGLRVPSGVYLYTMEASRDFKSQRKMVMIK